MKLLGKEFLTPSYLKFLKDEEVRFRLKTTLKMTLIPLITLSILYLFLMILLKMDLIFFQANGLINISIVEDAFYDSTFQEVLSKWYYLAAFFAFVICVGFYISKLILRPFRAIGTYCDSILDDDKKSLDYNPDFFSELKLLTGFSEYFFNIVDNAIKNKELVPIEIPSKYTRIHKPVFETSFFAHFSIFIIFTSICAAVGIHIVAVDIHDSIVEMAMTSFFKSDARQHYFLAEQKEVWSSLIYGVVTFHIFVYLAFALHLYNLVSSPAFGIFATMRSFIKGNYKARVHLIGHYYVRNQCRKLNKYLDYLEKNYTSRS